MAAVEFAIVLPLLIAIAFGIAEFSRAMYEYDALVEHVRAAARYLTTVDPGDATNVNRAICIVKAADPYATCFVSSPPTSPAPPAWLPGLSAATVTVSWSGNTPGLQNVQTGAGTVNLVTVTVENFAFDNLLLSFIPTIGTFGPISATMVRQGT